VFGEVIFDIKLEPISLTNSLSKADVSKYKDFFKKNIHGILSNSLLTLNLLNIFLVI